MSGQKQYEMLFRLSAELGSSYSSTFKNASQSLVQMQNELQELNKAQGNITAYQKQQSAVEATQKKLEALQQQYDPARN